MDITQKRHTELDDKKQGEIKIGEKQKKAQNLAYISFILLPLEIAFMVYVIITNNIAISNLSSAIIPAWQSIILAIGVFITFFLIPLLSMDKADELDNHINMKTYTVSAFALYLIYPIWRLLSFGELLPVPTGDQAFLISLMAGFIGFIIFRIRT